MFQYLKIGNSDLPFYDIINYFSAAVLFFCVFLKLNPYSDLTPAEKRKKHNKLYSFLQLLVMCVVFAALFFVLNPGFGKWFTNGNNNYYGTLVAWFIPFSVFPLFFHKSSLATMDLLSGALPLQLFIAKLACFCQGCCSGYEMPGSFYFNQETNRYEFPVQLLEAFVALGLYFYFLHYKKKNKIPGSVFPLYIIIYSVSRFITEFFREDLSDIISVFNAYQIMSVVFLLIGGVLFYFVWIYKYEKE
ncbi:MAG: prolipoprotein diacylglyceryl transferase, partial [Clostridia bacterium]|nr:prolipoprotein diacylglyceryl transferase [Clostridia bacterium]